MYYVLQKSNLWHMNHRACNCTQVTLYPLQIAREILWDWTCAVATKGSLCACAI